MERRLLLDLRPQAYDLNGRPASTATPISLEVANNQVHRPHNKHSEPPTGHPAAGSPCNSAYVSGRLEAGKAQKRNSFTKKYGQARPTPPVSAMLPAGVLPGGNQYLVTARGTNPAFFYWDMSGRPIWT